jgi:hypothetical protein
LTSTRSTSPIRPTCGGSTPSSGRSTRTAAPGCGPPPPAPPPRREAFIALVRALPGHWIANETPDVLTVPGLPTPPGEALHNVLSLDGRPLAWNRSHGQAITWFG